MISSILIIDFISFVLWIQVDECSTKMLFEWGLMEGSVSNIDIYFIYKNNVTFWANIQHWRSRREKPYSKRFIFPRSLEELPSEGFSFEESWLTDHKGQSKSKTIKSWQLNIIIELSSSCKRHSRREAKEEGRYDEKGEGNSEEGDAPDWKWSKQWSVLGSEWKE